MNDITEDTYISMVWFTDLLILVFVFKWDL